MWHGEQQLPERKSIMAENKTNIADLNDDSTKSGELTESEAAKISGGRASAVGKPAGEVTYIDTIYPPPKPTRHDDIK
jgi:hypothetical protein